MCAANFSFWCYCARQLKKLRIMRSYPQQTLAQTRAVRRQSEHQSRRRADQTHRRDGETTASLATRAPMESASLRIIMARTARPAGEDGIRAKRTAVSSRSPRTSPPLRPANGPGLRSSRRQTRSNYRFRRSSPLRPPVVLSVLLSHHRRRTRMLAHHTECSTFRSLSTMSDRPRRRHPRKTRSSRCRSSYR